MTEALSSPMAVTGAPAGRPTAPPPGAAGGPRFRLVDEQVELTGLVAAAALVLLTAGGLVMVARTGRVL